MSDHARPAKLATVEDVLTALAAQCDGAKSRDGRGFNRPDANEGGRLAALVRAGFGWSPPDVAKAKDIVGRYARQAGVVLGGGRRSREDGIERSIRQGWIRPGSKAVDDQKPYDFATVSPGGRSIHLWMMSGSMDDPELRAGLKAIASRRHGERRIAARSTRNAETTVNGVRRKLARIEIDLNETTRIPFLELCSGKGILVEPSLEIPCGRDVDEVRRHARSAWIHEGTRDGEKGVWAVFDLATKDDAFTSAVKTSLPGSYRCDPADDWNWYVRIDDGTAAIVLGISREFGFACTEEFASVVVPAPFLTLDG